MTQTAAEVLAHLDSGDVSWQMWIYDNADVIRRALKIAAMIDSGECERPDDPQRDGYDVGHTHGWNDCLEKLRAVK